MKNKYLRVIVSIALAAMLMLAMAVPAYADAGISLSLSPSTVSVTAGTSFTLTANATYSGLTGTETTTGISYTWTVNSTGNQTTGQSITVQANNSDTITCTASGTVTTNGVTQNVSATQYCTVTVTSAVTPTSTPSAATVTTPTITSNPANATIKVGQTATLSVGATVANINNGVWLEYQWYYTANSNGSGAQAIPGANSASYTTSASVSSTYYYFAAVRATNGSAYSTIVYSNPAKVTYSDGQMKITKNPTGETVNVGGSAMFIARADNAASFEWRIVSKDTTKTVKAKDASSYFKGLSVSGTNSDTLVLSNIPASMNEWSVECKFVASDGKTTLYTTGAVIKVNGATSSTTASASPSASSYVPGAPASPSATATTKPNTGDSTISAPSISTQPVGATLTEGESTTLSVSATSTDSSDDVEMKYQWYLSDTNSTTGGTAIGGAQSATYKPDTISGTKYYYVGVWSTDGTHQSKTIYSTPVAVTYTSATASPSPSPDEDADTTSSSFSSVILPVIGMVVAAAAIGVGVFFLLKNVGKGKKSGKYDDYDDYDDDYKT